MSEATHRELPGTWSQIRLVATREIRARGGSRSFKVSTLVTLIIVLALVAVPASLGDDGPTEWDLAVIGSTPAGFEEAAVSAASTQDASLEVTVRVDEGDPEQILDDEDVDAVLVDGTEMVSEETPPDGLRAAVSAAVGQSRLLEQLRDAGLDPEEAVEAASTEPVEVRAIEETDEDGTAEAASFVGVVALFIAINSYGAWVLTGVLEEKSSRVVEIIVAAMPPRALLAGKVLGIGLLGIAQLVLVASVGFGAAVAFDVTDVPLDLLPAFGSILVWFILGFALYAVGYAAAGSLVSRQEDAQSAASPLAYIVLTSYFVALFVVAPNPEGLAAKILSFVPFIAPMAMPPRIAQGAAAPWEIAGSILAMLVGIWLMVRLAARIYEQSLLRMGAPIKIWTAIRDVRKSSRRADAA